MTRNGDLDVAVIFSQDQDFAEVAQEARDISRSQECWIKIVSMFPDAGGAMRSRGINGTDWIRMDQNFYNNCLDSRDYRLPLIDRSVGNIANKFSSLLTFSLVIKTLVCRHQCF